MLDAVAARYRLACTDFTKVTLALNNPVRWPHRGSPGVHLARGATLVKVGFNKEAFEPLLAAIKDKYYEKFRGKNSSEKGAAG